MTLISVFLSVLSYYCIEKNDWFSSAKFVSVSLPLIIVFGTITFLYPNNPFNKSLSLYDDESYAIGNYADEYNNKIREAQFNSSNCFITIGNNMEDYNWSGCLQLSDTKKNILLIGDSHAAQFSQSLQEQIGDLLNIMELNAGIVFPFKNPKGQPESVKLINRFYNEFLPDHIDELDVVILSLHWPMYRNPQIGYSKKELLKSYTEFLNYFKNKGVSVLVIGQQESYTIAFSKIIMLQKTLAKDNVNPFINKYIDAETNRDMEWLKENTPNSQYIDIYDLEEVVKLNDEGVPYMVDKITIVRWERIKL
ncbi:SGNH hydrolase domain-containing protein [Aequorivita xiaoshiensis]|uniref:SGNH domain-containing protein n=1 Tax=Aequorivita xiaoshiensis TaxID=2874476 RepID=A0A9X1R4B9_9FLAO|nr:SGNH hydrolase domain-containing protein [Aequorivita xiaoshiensis]MCG2431657.1 hypothetical protein [Aequorivita xiaoshiensis]